MVLVERESGTNKAGPGWTEQLYANVRHEQKLKSACYQAPPAPEQTEQAVIPGMEGPPSPENKVIDLSSVRAGQEQTDPVKEGGQEWEKPQEEPEPPRPGRRPQNKASPFISLSSRTPNG